MGQGLGGGIPLVSSGASGGSRPAQALFTLSRQHASDPACALHRPIPRPAGKANGQSCSVNKRRRGLTFFVQGDCCAGMACISQQGDAICVYT